MEESLRLFIAINFPSSVKKQIGHLVGELVKKYPEIRWEKEENFHLTLKFLGWSRSKIEEIIQGMERSVEETKPFWFQPEKLGFFLRQNLIVWLGVKTQEGLLKIVKNLEDKMGQIGFPKETRPASFHITIGRAKRVSPREKWQRIALEISNFPKALFPKFKVKEIDLMKSRLTAHGSIYSIVKKIPLT